MSRRFAWLLRLLRAEGPRSIAERLRDHLAHGSWRYGRAARLGPEPAPPGLRTPVLHLLATPAVPWLGGVQLQLARRRETGGRDEAFALLYPGSRGGWRLEVQRGGRRRAWGIDRETGLSGAVERAAAFLGARLLHVENLAGLPPAELLDLARAGWPLVLSLHDFAAFCSRPNLLEHPQIAFCHYSTDLERCARCLGAIPQAQADWRATTAELLARAAAVVYPSVFLRREHLRLFPDLAPERQHVVPPVAAMPVAPMRPPTAGRLRVAFVGNVRPHKGSRVFTELLDGLTPADRRRWSFSAYGGGDPDELFALRRRGVAVRGYYRAGSLGRRLRRDGVDLVLLLSVFPETYSIALDECRAAGVPVLALDSGALGERLRREGGGWTVDPDRSDRAGGGAAGVLARLRELARTHEGASVGVAGAGADPAAAYADIYARIEAGRAP